MFAKREANRIVMFRERRSIDDEIDLRERFVALPKPNLIVDEVDARAAFCDFVGANYFVKMDTDFGGGVRHGEVDAGRVFFEAAPVAFVGERFAFEDAEGREEAPAADEAGLSGRKPDLLDGKEAFVVEDVAVNHAGSFAKSVESLL